MFNFCAFCLKYLLPLIKVNNTFIKHIVKHYRYTKSNLDPDELHTKSMKITFQLFSVPNIFYFDWNEKTKSFLSFLERQNVNSTRAVMQVVDRYNSSFSGKGQGPQLGQGVDEMLSLLSSSLRFRFKLCRKRAHTNEVLCLKCCMVESNQDH